MIWTPILPYFYVMNRNYLRPHAKSTAMRLTICTLLFLFCISASQAQTKRALIIAIGDYPDPEKNGWRQINSTNDVPLIENALLRQNFLPQNITSLVDVQATKTGIENALNELI